MMLRLSLFSFCSTSLFSSVSSIAIRNMSVNLKYRFQHQVYYNSFVELEKGSISFSDHFHQESIPESSTGISFVYSSTLCVCQNQRAFKTFKELAERGKCSMRWLFVFKLFLIINDKNEILDFIFSE